MTDYQKQANEFLSKYGIELKVKPTNSGKCPPFCDDSKHMHGVEHQIRMYRPMTGKRITFKFWNSLKDAREGTLPTAYDVLSCSGSDLHCPDTFEEFCSEYGFDTDSRKALKTFKACSAFGNKLRDFFDSEDIREALGEIQ